MRDMKLQDKLVGALIGLARATDGNEHLINPSATAVIIESLAALYPAAEDKVLENLLSRVQEEKRKLVPNCFLCASPCGRTSDYDLAELQRADAKIRDLKNRILAGIRRLAVSLPENRDDLIFYKALVVIGMDDYSADDLLPIVREVEEMGLVR